MSPAVNAPVLKSRHSGLDSRYEALIHLAEAIRSHPDEKDLFRTLANGPREVVEFDALCQFDGRANWVQWYFVATRFAPDRVTKNAFVRGDSLFAGLASCRTGSGARVSRACPMTEHLVSGAGLTTVDSPSFWYVACSS